MSAGAPGLVQLRQDPSDSQIVDPGVELAVREGPGATLSKLNIGAGIQSLAAPKRLHILAAAQRVTAALADNGPPPASARIKAAKMPAGPKPTTTGRSVTAADTLGMTYLTARTGSTCPFLARRNKKDSRGTATSTV